MSSCSVLPCPDAYALGEALETRRPRLLARAESRVVNEGVERAHLEFLRITDVTERISESRMCFAETETGAMAELPGLEESMLASQKVNRGVEKGEFVRDGRVQDVSLTATCVSQGRLHRRNVTDRDSRARTRTTLHM